MVRAALFLSIAEPTAVRSGGSADLCERLNGVSALKRSWRRTWGLLSRSRRVPTCRRSVMGLINIYYKTMLEMHPLPTDFLTMIDGPIRQFHRNPKTSNTCASEISYALNCIDGHHVDTSGDYGKGSFLVKTV